MGLSIHCKGSIRDYSQIDELTEEVRDICKDMKWVYHIWENKDSNDVSNESIKYSAEDLKGISFSAEKCEPVFLTFLPNGQLVSIVYFLFENDNLLQHFIHTKTQYAGPDVHIAIIKLLHYLDKKYMAELEVDDEGYYWETGDEKILRNQFSKFDAALNSFTNMVTNLKSIPGETAESLADRLEKLLLKKSGDK